MEENLEEAEDAKSTSSDSFIDGSEDDGPSTFGQDERLHFEASVFEEDYVLHTSPARVSCLC